MFRTAIALTCLILLGIASATASVPQREGIPAINISTIYRYRPITSWRLIGPFYLSTGATDVRYTNALEESVLGHDYLVALKSSESPLVLRPPSTARLITLRHDVMDQHGDVINERHFIDQVVTYPDQTISTQQVYWGFPQKFAITYAATQLQITQDRDATFIVSGNSPMKVWLNGSVIATPALGAVGHNWGGRYILNVHLKRGGNSVLIKILSFPLRNDFAFWVADQKGAEQFRRQNPTSLDILEHVVIARNHPLSIDSRNLDGSRTREAYIDIVGTHGRVVRTTKIDLAKNRQVSTIGIPDGVYDARVRFDQQSWISERFYIGSTRDALHRYQQICAQRSSGLRQVYPCSLVKPFGDMLSIPQVSERLDREKPLVLLMSQIEWGFEGDKPDARLQLGDRHLYATPYVSMSDGSEQYYYVHLPPDYSESRAIPLVVICPFRASAGRVPDGAGPPTEVALEFSKYVFFADKYGYAVVMPIAKGLGMSNPEGMDDVRQVLGDVESRYNVNRTRIYLFGDCAGGRGALLLGELDPHEFAAISTLNAATGRQIYEREFTLSVDDGLRGHVASLQGTPILLIHGDFYPHSPVSQAYEFRELCKNAGVRVNITLLRGDGKFDYQDPVDRSFAFFQGKRL